MKITSVYQNILILILITCINACTSKDEELRTWIDVERKGTTFSENDLKYLIDRFGEPTSVSIKGDEKQYGYVGIASFYIFDFTKEEAEGLIREDRIRFKNLINWLETTGAKQGLPSGSRATSQNWNWEEYKQKRFVEDEEYFKAIYLRRVGDRKVSFNELVRSFNEKYPDLSFTQSADSISRRLNLSDFEKKEYTSTIYTFQTNENVWFSSFYDLRDYDGARQKDFLIDLYRDLVIDSEGFIRPFYSDDGSYCISEKGKEKLLNYVYGKWIHKSYLGEGEIVLSKDGQFSLRNRLASNSGNWKITCAGEILLPNTYLQISDLGIHAGDTLYKKQ